MTIKLESDAIRLIDPIVVRAVAALASMIFVVLKLEADARRIFNCFWLDTSPRSAAPVSFNELANVVFCTCGDVRHERMFVYTPHLL